MWSLSKKAVLLPPRMDQLEFGGYLKSGEPLMLLSRVLVVHDKSKFFIYVFLGLQSMDFVHSECSLLESEFF